MKIKKLFLCLLAAAFTLTPVCGAYAAPEIVEGDGENSILIKLEGDTESKAEGEQSIAIGNNAQVTTIISSGGSESGGIAIGANASAIGGVNNSRSPSISKTMERCARTGSSR